MWTYVGETYGARTLIFYWPQHDLIVTASANSAVSPTDDALIRLIAVPAYTALKDARLIPGTAAVPGGAAEIVAAGTNGLSGQ